MGLIKETKDTNNKTEITDCVGKVGFCEYVTDPKTDKLYKNFDLKDLHKKTTVDKTTENDLRKQFFDILNNDTISDKKNCDEDCSCEKESDKEQDSEKIIASALYEILERLDKIEKRLYN